MSVGRLVWRSFGELSVRDLHDVLRLRGAVFVLEQSCAFQEIDGRDPEALHLMAWLGETPSLAGTLRVIGPGPEGPAAHIGRVATAMSARGAGLGRRMMRSALAEIALRFGPVPTEVAAQTAVESFYGRLGFERISADFDEDGIAHCHMRYRPGEGTVSA